mgnify:CR=1 FL=1
MNEYEELRESVLAMEFRGESAANLVAQAARKTLDQWANCDMEENAHYRKCMVQLVRAYNSLSNFGG